MRARRGVVWAMSLMGTLLVGAVRAQEPPLPPSLPEDPIVQAPDDREAEPFQEEAAGPTPGAPTLSLSRAVRMALEQNFSILGAADALRASRFGESVALAQFFPKLTPRYQRSEEDSTLALDGSQRVPWTGGVVTASGSLRTSPRDEAPATRTGDLRLTLTQPLLRGFGPTASFFDLTNARRGRQAQERNFELARQQLALQVTSTFYQVVKQRQLLQVARQSLKRSRTLREASEARMNVGLASKLDVFRAELQAQQAQEAMVQSEAGLEGALESFRFLLGRNPRDPLEPEAVALPETIDLEIEPLPILVERAFGNRLELEESRDQLRDAQRSLTIARQRLLPQLDLSVTLSQLGVGNSVSDAFRPTDRRVDVFFTTSYPLERTSDQAGKALAEIEVEARKRNLRQRELQVESDVRAAVRELERIRKSVALQRKGVEFAEQQHRLATLRYQRGLASNFDVVDAEGSLVSARTALVGLLTDFQVARAQLLRATGVLDVDEEFQP